MKKTSIFLVPLLILCFASIGLSQQAGSLKGTITDDEGNPLPGVTAIISSPKMQGIQSYITTESGDFRFPTLPPGTYTLRTELSGFQTTERPEIRVRVGSTTTVDVQMTPSTLAEEVTVTAPSPIVDVESSDIAVTFSEDLITSIPIRRDIIDIFQSSPATVPRDASNDYQKMASVSGGSVEESKISIDGVGLLDPNRGYISAEVSFDAIEEVEMVIGGHKAEVGQVAAGFLNVVTKSGGNTFSGSITAGGTHESLTQVVIPQEQVEGFGLIQPQIKEYKWDVGLSFGGPIIKDKVWFFLAPRYGTFKQSTFFVPFTDPDGYSHPAYPNTRSDYIGLGKITVQLASNLKWFAMYQYNQGIEKPEMWAVTKIYSPLESQKMYDDSSHTVSSVLTYVMNQNSFLEARFGMVRRLMSLPFSNEWVGPENRGAHVDKTTQYEWGSPDSDIYDYYRTNYNFSVVLIRFQDAFLGADHEFKAGAEYEWALTDRKGSRPNPYFYHWNNGEPWYYSDVEPYKGRFQIFSGATDILRSHAVGFRRMSGFLQDTVNIGERLTLNLGIRYDETHDYIPAKHWEGWDDVWENGLANVLLPDVFRPAGSTMDSVRMEDLMVYKFFSPRVGLVYDLFGNGKTVLKGTYARYGSALLTTVTERLNPLQDIYVTFTWWDDNHNGEFDLPPVDRYQAGGYQPYTTDTEALRKQVNSDLGTPYTDELTLGITQQITEDFSVSFNFMYKSAKNLLGRRNLNIEKDSQWWVPYTVTDPGDDGKLNTGDEQSLTVYMLRSDAPSNFYQVDNIDEAWRKYWGFTTIFQKRMSHGWMLTGSIAYNKAYGNFAHGYNQWAGGQNFWDPNYDINRAGRLQYDRPIIIKLMSTVDLPLDFSLSGYFRYYSGAHFERRVTVYFPSTLNGYVPRSSSTAVNAEPEGDRDLQPEAILDLRLEKRFQIRGFTVGVWAEVTNLFGHWYFTYAQSQLAGGYIYPDGSYARYARYGQPNAVYGTRTLNFGARIRF